MQHISTALQDYSYSYGKEPKGSSIAIEGKLSRKEEDNILDSYPELIDPRYRAWFIKNHLRRKGKREFIRLADKAMKYGRNKQKMFVHLLD